MVEVRFSPPVLMNKNAGMKDKQSKEQNSHIRSSKDYIARLLIVQRKVIFGRRAVEGWFGIVVSLTCTFIKKSAGLCWQFNSPL